MSKKSITLLGTIGLLIVSAVAATSSTFAWFTSVRQATINYNDATVSSTDSSLGIVYKSSLNTMETSLTDNVLTLTGSNLVTDISGDGQTFYKPVWASQTDSQTGVASAIQDVALSAAASADGFLVDFTVTLSSSGGQDLKVYLGPDTKFTQKNPGTSATTETVVDATRLAVLDASSNVVLRWAPVVEATPTYLTSAAAGTAAYGVDGFNLVTDSTLKSGAITRKSTIATADSAGYGVATITAGETVDVTFRAWVEGADVHTVNEIKGAVFSLDIDLYALAVIA